MGRQRNLTKAKLFACRWEYENTAIGQREIARKYGWDPRRDIAQQGWRKAEVLRNYDGPEGKRQFKEDVAAAAKAAYDRKIIQAMEEKLARADKKAHEHGIRHGEKPASIPAGNATNKLFDDAPVKPPPKRPGRPKKVPPPEPGQTGDIIKFPGPFIPPLPTRGKKERPEAVPPQSKSEQAQNKIQLSMLRGEVSLRQLRQLQDHDEVLEDYRQLLANYLNPGRFVDVEGLDQEKAQEKLYEVSRAALRILLPTERDTLAGAVLALNRAVIASIGATRSVLGIAAPRPRAGLTPDEEVGAGGSGVAQTIATLDLASLRTVKSAMEMVTGHRAANNEPPMPPPPEPLDDLVVSRDGPTPKDPSGR